MVGGLAYFRSSFSLGSSCSRLVLGVACCVDPRSIVVCCLSFADFHSAVWPQCLLGAGQGCYVWDLQVCTFYDLDFEGHLVW